MNIFYLNDDPVICAKQHCDKHVVKMILEYAQLLSTAHRVLDGKMYIDKTKTGRKIKRWKLENEETDELLFLASHIQHPSGAWCRKNMQNYMWLSELLEALCKEYTHRYGKVHSVQRSGLMDYLCNVLPNNIPIGPFTEPPPAMPEYCKVPLNSILSYHNYYVNEKVRFARWTARDIPLWYAERVQVQ
jgi:hypothetical protein